MAKRTLKTWKLRDGTRCTAEVVLGLLGSYDPEDQVGPSDIAGLPENWRDLEWVLVVQQPCMWGDDLRVAYDEKAGKGYVVHDMVCSRYSWGKSHLGPPLSIWDIVIQVANDPGEPDE